MEDELKNATSFGQIFEALGVKVEKKEEGEYSIKSVRNALQRHSAKIHEKAYTAAVESVADELQYGSAKHFAMGLSELFFDSVLAFWDPIKSFLKTDYVQQIVAEKLSESEGEKHIIFKKGSLNFKLDRDVAELIGKVGEDDKEPESQDKSKKLYETTKRLGAYVKNIADYCKENDKSPESVLDTPEDMVKIITKTYGSLEKYEEKQVEMYKFAHSIFGYMEKTEQVPLNVLIPAGLSMIKANEEVVSDMDTDFVGELIHTYIQDVLKFGKAFLTEYTKNEAQKLMQYKEIGARLE